jgi:hypothetical protein
LPLHKQLTDSQAYELENIIHRKFKHHHHQSSQSQLTPTNVNSAFTNIAHNRNLIVVYRNEDALKTLIHEIIHAFNLDGNKMIESRMYETTTELSAFIIHICMYCYKHSTSYDDYKLYIEAVLYMELQHAHIQATKVYYLNEGITNALHYYVYKYQLLKHWGEYMEWLGHNANQWFHITGNYDGLNHIIHKPFIPVKTLTKHNIKNMRLMYIE